MKMPLPTHADFSDACTSLSTQLRMLRFAIPPEVPVETRKRIEAELARMSTQLTDAAVLASFSKP